MTDRIGIDLSAVDTAPQFTVGTVFSVSQPTAPDKVYKYIKYVSGGVSSVVGNVAYYVKPATDVTGTQLTSVVAEGDGVGAGAAGTLDVMNAVTDVACATALDHSAEIILCQFPR